MASRSARRKRALHAWLVLVAFHASAACSSGMQTSAPQKRQGAEPRETADETAPGARPTLSAIVADPTHAPLFRAGDPTEPVGAVRVVDNGLPEGGPALPRGVVRLGVPTGSNVRAEISPDGTLLAASVDNEGWQLVDARSGKRVRPLLAKAPAGDVQVVHFSPNGKHLAMEIGGKPTTVQIVDATTGAVEHETPGKDYGVDEIVFAPDSSAIAFLLQDYDEPQRIVVMNVATGAVTKQVIAKKDEDRFGRFALGPGAKYAALSRSREASSVTLVDLTQKKKVAEWTTASSVDRLVFDPSGESLLGVRSSALARWRVPSGERVFERTLDLTSSFLAPGPSGTWFVLDYLDALIAVDAEGTVLRRYRDEMVTAESIGFTADGEVVTNAGYASATNHWIRETGQPVVYSATYPSRAESVQFSADGKRVFGVFRDDVEVWDDTSGKLVAIDRGEDARIRSAMDAAPNVDWKAFRAAMSAIAGEIGEVRVAGGKVRAIVSTNAKILVFEPPNTTPILEVERATLPVAHLLADGSGVLVGGYNDPFRVLDLPSGKARFALADGQPIRLEDAVPSPDGKLVFGRPENATRITVYGTNGKLVGELTADGDEKYVTSAAVSPDGKWVVVGFIDHVARVYATATRKLVATLDGHTDGVMGVAFSPDGKSIATAGRDGTILVHPTAGTLP